MSVANTHIVTSFIGHLSGIIAGLFLGWGAFRWITPYWFLTSLVGFHQVSLAVVLAAHNVPCPCSSHQGYFVVAILLSLAATTGIRIPGVQVFETYQ